MIFENLTWIEFYEYILDIEDFEALEIHTQMTEDGYYDVLIPYLMNDAVECILKAEHCDFHGVIPEKIYAVNGFYQEKEILFETKEGDILMAEYRFLSLEGHCYQYHLIGHAWRKEAGEEHLRRLLNILCILNDKYHYLGEDFCNEIEMEIAPLIEFAPFCAWTPINKSICDWYPESQEGIEAMKKLALEAKDLAYFDLICNYDTEHSQKSREMKGRILTGELNKAEHADIYQCLMNKIKEASDHWEIRDYGAEWNEKILHFRQEQEDVCIKEGFSGAYPEFIRYNGEKDCIEQIRYVEEHPFTALDWEDYSFHMFKMESSYPGNEKKTDDYGFFLADGHESCFHRIH